MNAARQQAYLDALGIQVWVRKGQVSQQPEFISARLTIGPGGGQVLMVCNSVAQPASQLASDIARSLRYEPVWAWLSPDGTGSCISDAVSEQLFTTVVIFGGEVVSALFQRQLPETIHSARILLVPALEELINTPAKRRALWAVLCNSHLAGIRQAPGAS